MNEQARILLRLSYIGSMCRHAHTRVTHTLLPMLFLVLAACESSTVHRLLPGVIGTRAVVRTHNAMQSMRVAVLPAVAPQLSLSYLRIQSTILVIRSSTFGVALQEFRVLPFV